MILAPSVMPPSGGYQAPTSRGRKYVDILNGGPNKTTAPAFELPGISTAVFSIPGYTDKAVGFQMPGMPNANFVAPEVDAYQYEAPQTPITDSNKPQFSPAKNTRILPNNGYNNTQSIQPNSLPAATFQNAQNTYHALQNASQSPHNYSNNTQNYAKKPSLPGQQQVQAIRRPMSMNVSQSSSQCVSPVLSTVRVKFYQST